MHQIIRAKYSIQKFLFPHSFDWQQYLNRSKRFCDFRKIESNRSFKNTQKSGSGT